MLNVRSLSFTYPNGTRALHEVSLRLAHAERLAIVGPSGCGKSTLLRLLGGLLEPTAGSVDSGQSRIGMMFQEAALLPWLTVTDNLALPGQLGKHPQRPSDAVIANALDRVELPDIGRSFPGQLSGGMAQRVALARALINEPDVLLLDEPFGALDALTREVLTERVGELLDARGTAAIIVTHSIREAIFFADRVLVMSARPGTLIGEIAVPLPRPRRWHLEADPLFAALNLSVRAKLANVPV